MRSVARGPLLTVDETASVVNASRRWVYRRIARGDLPSLRLGDGPKPRIRIDPRDLDRYLERARERAG